MALPTSYFTSSKNVAAILTAIQNAKAPERFTQAFLEALGFKSTSDRLMIGVLKALGFLDDTGRPTQRYFDYLDQTQSERVLADAIREAYADLFSINVNAERMTKTEFINKAKTLSQGTIGDSVLDKMALTFSTLVGLADFSGPPSVRTQEKPAPEVTTSSPTPISHPQHRQAVTPSLVYNLQIHLPETRDPAVYDALFKSLKEHLL